MNYRRKNRIHVDNNYSFGLSSVNVKFKLYNDKEPIGFMNGVSSMLCPAGGHQGSHKAHQAGNQSDRI